MSITIRTTTDALDAAGQGDLTVDSGVTQRDEVGEMAGSLAVMRWREQGAKAVVARVFNVVDDQPLPLHDWLPRYAAGLGAKRPFRVPAWLARPVSATLASPASLNLRAM